MENKAQLREELLARAREERPPQRLERSVLEAVRAVRGRRLAAAVWPLAALVAAGVIVVAWQWSRYAPSVDVTAEGRANGASSDSSKTVASGPDGKSQRTENEASQSPCSRPTVAHGDVPLVDDFEHGRLGPPVGRDGRRGIWIYVTDQDAEGEVDTSIRPSLLPLDERTAENQRAVHLSEGLLRDWGAALAFVFRPGRCYDASAYRGVGFRGRGGVRIQVSALEPRMVPVKDGGTCQEDCYFGHRAAIDLGQEWDTYEVSWDTFRRRGYNSKPLDPSRLHSLQFLIEPPDTPFDVWIDDVRLLPAETD